MRKLTYSFISDNEEISIQNFLRNKGYSARLISRLKKEADAIKKNGVSVHTNEKLSMSDKLEILLPKEQGSQKIEAVEMELQVVFEDKDILVVVKPSQQPVHISQGNYKNTLANGVAFYSRKNGESFPFRAVTRLDKDTTGLLVIAKNALSAAVLNEMVKKREIKSWYLAICKACVPIEGTIDAPIGRANESIIERMVDYEKGERAITHYQRIACQNGYSLLKLSLETGRTHQIRVHMKHIGYPLCGDSFYQGDDSIIKRQALHCAHLSFHHPVYGTSLSFESPLPEDMQKLINR